MSIPTTATTPVDSVAAADLTKLHELGVPQQLHRRMSRSDAFAVPFSTTSVLTGIPAMLGIAMVLGGPGPTVWSWLVGGLFVLCLAYSMGEVCSAFPVSGALYFWSAQLAVKYKRFWSWMTGWLNALGQIAGTAGATYSMALFVGAFAQFKWGIAVSRHGTFAIFLALLLLCTLLNSFAVRTVMWANRTSVVIHVVGTVLIAGALIAVPAHHESTHFVFTTIVNETGQHNWYVWLLAPLTLMYTKTGIDAPGHMSEETERATLNAPNAMVKAVLWTYLLGTLLLLALLFGVQNYTAEASGSFGVAPASIMVDALPNWLATLLIIWLLAGMFFCIVACMTATSRQFYGAGRDRVFPGGAWLHYTSPRTKAPVRAVWAAAALMALVGLPAYWTYYGFTAITSVATTALFGSYAIPVFLRWKAGKRFTPGDYKIRAPRVVAGMGLVYVVLAAVTVCLPTGFPITASNFNWAAVMIGGWLLVLMLWFAVGGQRTYTGPRRYSETEIADIEANVV